jgi:hypothetical protein
MQRNYRYREPVKRTLQLANAAQCNGYILKALQEIHSLGHDLLGLVYLLWLAPNNLVLFLGVVCHELVLVEAVMAPPKDRCLDDQSDRWAGPNPL